MTRVGELGRTWQGTLLVWCFTAETGNEEIRKQEAADFRVKHSRLRRDERNDQELQHFFISRTEGEALEVTRGAEREPGLEQWRRLAALCDPCAA